MYSNNSSHKGNTAMIVLCLIIVAALIYLVIKILNAPVVLMCEGASQKEVDALRKINPMFTHIEYIKCRIPKGE